MNPTFAAGDRVKHPRFGIGEVLLDRGATVVVTFEHGLEQCPPALLQRLDSFTATLARPDLDPPAEVLARALGDAVRSVNDAWGVFSRSRIALLPHQLWVCRQVSVSACTRTTSEIASGRCRTPWPRSGNGLPVRERGCHEVGLPGAFASNSR